MLMATKCTNMVDKVLLPASLRGSAWPNGEDEKGRPEDRPDRGEEREGLIAEENHPAPAHNAAGDPPSSAWRARSGMYCALL
jgi:hypothetical protein